MDYLEELKNALEYAKRNLDANRERRTIIELLENKIREINR